MKQLLSIYLYIDICFDRQFLVLSILLHLLNQMRLNRRCFQHIQFQNLPKENRLRSKCHCLLHYMLRHLCQMLQQQDLFE